MRIANCVKTSVVAAAFVVASAIPVAAVTYVVSADGLGDYPTIQAALDIVVDGDIIELSDETFTGDGSRDIVVPAVSVVIRSQGDYGGYLADQTGLDDNISVDPQFCGLSIANYSLHEFSPCLPGGNNCSVQLGAFGQGCDSPVQKMSWGRVKSMWR